jgi:hypothetical protein
LCPQASAYHNIEEIEVLGLIVYTGPSSSARQTSTLFGGSPIARKLIESNGLDLRRFIDNITTALK